MAGVRRHDERIGRFCRTVLDMKSWLVSLIGILCTMFWPLLVVRE